MPGLNLLLLSSAFAGIKSKGKVTLEGTTIKISVAAAQAERHDVAAVDAAGDVEASQTTISADMKSPPQSASPNEKINKDFKYM